MQRLCDLLNVNSLYCIHSNWENIPIELQNVDSKKMMDKFVKNHDYSKEYNKNCLSKFPFELRNTLIANDYCTILSGVNTKYIKNYFDVKPTSLSYQNIYTKEDVIISSLHGNDIEDLKKYIETKTDKELVITQAVPAFDISTFKYDENIYKMTLDNEEEEVGDVQAVQIFLKWCKIQEIEIISVSENVIWYNPNTGLWNDDIKSIKPFFFQCKELPFNYCSKDKFQNSMLSQLIHYVPVNDNWYLNIDSVGYLPVKDGVLDFQNKVLVDYHPKFGFFSKLDIEYDEDLDTTEVEERLFKNLFKSDDIEYLKICLARAIAGHMDKLLFFFLGDGNSGKGLFEVVFRKLLGKLWGIILGGALTAKDSGGDSAKLLSWMVKIRNCKLAYCQEINMDKPLNGIILKKISSGGDGVVARTNGKDEMDFILQFLTIIAGNDIPTIQPIDDAFQNRMAYFDMPNVYLNEQAILNYKGDKNVIPIDTEIKDVWARKKSTCDALFTLLVKSYSETLPTKPQSVIQSSKEWTEEDDIYEKIKDLFEIPKERLDAKGVPIIFSTSSKAMQYAVQSAHIHISPNKLGRIMTKLGHPSETKNINGTNTRVYFDIILKKSSCDF